jgi:glutamate carboxypeptidase
MCDHYAQQIRSYLESQLPEMLSLLEDLVNRNTSSDFKEGIDQAGNLMAEAYRKLGFEIEILQHHDCGNGVIARKKGNGKNILLICHLDSVFPEGTARLKSFRIEGGKAMGNGVLDMKACLVGCLYAVKALEALNIDNLPGLTVFMSGDEEKGSLAVLDAIQKEGRRSQWCLVTEGSRPGMAVVVQRKGNAFARITAHGRAAHAGNEPHVGRNAVVELALKAAKLNALNDFEKGTTVAITRMSGGTNRIIIPEDAFMDVDMRFYTMEEWEKVHNTFIDILAAPEIEGVTLRYDLTFNRPPLAQTPDTLLNVVKEASKELNMDFLTVRPGGVSDGNFVSAIGVPVVDGMGPAGGMMCSPEEFLEIDTMVPCAARLALVIAKLGAAD